MAQIQELVGKLRSGYQTESMFADLGQPKISSPLLSQYYRQAPAQVRLLHRSRRTHRVPLRVQQDYEAWSSVGRPEAILQKSKTKNQNEDNNHSTRDRLRDLPEWLEEFADNLEYTEVPALANTSHDSDSERPTKVASRKHGIYTHFSKDRNCEVRKRTKITRALCRRRTGEAVPRTEKMMTW